MKSDMNELKDHKFIILCCDHYNPLGICRSLGERRINPIVVLYSKNPYLLNHCKYVKQLYQVESAEAGLAFIVEKWGNEIEKPFIYTADDYATMLLDQNYDNLTKKFHFFNCSRQGRLTYYQEKKNICDLAERCGIPQPKGEVLSKGELPKTLHYPVITKVTMSIKGAWKDDVYICQNEEELKEAYTHIKADELLVQEFVEKKNELCVDGISINEGKDIIFPYTSEYLRFGKQSYGNYMLMKVYENSEVIAKIKHIIQECHFSGIFSLECLIDKSDNLYFLEVNFRNSTWSYAYTFAGLNLPYLWAKWTLDGEMNLNDFSLRTKPFTAMSEISDFRSIIEDHSISVFTWFKQFHTCDCTYIYNSKDKLPFFFSLLNKPIMYIRRKLNHIKLQH